KLSGSGINVEFNTVTGGADGAPVVDFKTSFPDPDVGGPLTTGYQLDLGNGKLNLDYSKELLRASVATADLQIADYVYVHGGLAFEKRSDVDMTLTGASSTTTMSGFDIGAKGLSMFFGVNGPYSDTNGDGKIDSKDDINPEAVGLAISNVDLALTVLKPDGGTTRYIGLTASADGFEFVGSDDFQLESGAIEVELNLATGQGVTAATPVVDFSAFSDPDFPGQPGYHIVTSTGTSEVLNYSRRRIHASADDVLVNAGEFLYVKGNVAFDLGSREKVTINTGIPSGLGALAADGVQLINDALTEFGDTLTDLRSKVDDAFDSAIDTVIDTVNDTVDSVVDTIAEKITSELQSALADVKSEVSGLVNDSLTSATSDLTTIMVNALLDPVIDGIANKAPAGPLRGLIKTTLNPVKGLIATALDNLLKDSVNGAIDRITGAVSGALESGSKAAADKIKVEIHKVLDPQIDRIRRKLEELKAKLEARLAPVFDLLNAIAEIRIGADFSTLQEIEVDVTTIGISNASAFIGLPPKDGIDWTDTNSDGVLDKSFNDQGAIGLYVNDLNMGLGLFKPVLSDKLPSFTAAKIGIGSAGFADGGAGILELTAKDIDVQLNLGGPLIQGLGPLLGNATIDFVTSFPSADAATDGYAVATGTTSEPIYLDFDSELIRASVAVATIQISEFVYITGNVAFEKGATKTVAVTDGLLPISEVAQIAADFGLVVPTEVSIPATGAKTTNLEFMTIGASDVYAFVGMGGPYWTRDANDKIVRHAQSDDAVGLVVEDFDFGLAIMKPTNLDFAKYFTLDATANRIELVGIDGVTAVANDLKVQVNTSSPSVYGVPLFPVVDFAHTPEFASEELVLFDTNRDGRITRGELAALNNSLPAASRFAPLAGVATSDTTVARHDYLLTVLDTNDNGLIELDEAAKLLGGTSAALDRVKQADVDRDEKIDPLGYEVLTGGVPIYLDMSSPLIRAQGFIELDVFGIVTLVGNFAFELGPVQENVTIIGGANGKTKDTVSTMTIGASNVFGFIGWDGPYFLDGNNNKQIDVDAEGNPLPGEVKTTAKGIALNDLNVGIFLGLSLTDLLDPAAYFALDFSVESIKTVGIDFIQANATLAARMNVGVSLNDFAVIDFKNSTFTDSNGDPYTGGYRVNTGDPANPVVLGFDEFVVNVEIAGDLIIKSGNTSIAQMLGVFFLEIDGRGFKLFATASLLVGPDIGIASNKKPLLGISALGAVVINSSGFAADLDIDLGVNIAGLSVDVSARVLINTTGIDQEIVLPGRIVDFIIASKDRGNSLAASLLSRLATRDETRFYVIKGVAPDITNVTTVDNLLSGRGPITYTGSTHYVTAVIQGKFDFLGFAKGRGTAGISISPSKFQLYTDLSFGIGVSGIALNFDAVGIMEVSSQGLYLFVDVSMDAKLTSLLQVKANGKVLVDTRGVTDVFSLQLNGGLTIASVLTINGSFSIDVGVGGPNTWRVGMNLNGKLGPISIDAGGWIQSDGQFSLSVGGGLFFGVTGFSISGRVDGTVSLIKSGTNYKYEHGDTYTLTVQVTGSVRLTIVGIGIGASVTLGGTAVFGSSTTQLKLYARGCVDLWITKACGGGTIATITIPGSIFPSPPPRLATLDGGKLELNVGDDKDRRTVAKTVTAEEYQLTDLGGGKVMVDAFGYSEVFEGVTLITGDFGSDNDTLTLTSGFSVPVVASGGSGNDKFTSDGSGSVEFDGGEGKDTLIGGSGADTMNAGGGDDYIDGGKGADRVDGGSGNDVIFGIVPDLAGDVIVGGSDTDILEVRGTAAADVITLWRENGKLKISANGGAATTVSGSETVVVVPGEGADSVLLSGDLRTSGPSPEVKISLQEDTAAVDTVTITLHESTDTITLTGSQQPGISSLQPIAVGMQPATNLAAVPTTTATWVQGQTTVISSTDAGDLIQINALGGADNIVIPSLVARTQINGGNDADRIAVGSNATSTTNSGGNLNAIGALLTINGDAASDVLSLDETGESAANTGTLTATTLTGLGMTGSITYGTVETVNLGLGSGGDTIAINGSSVSTSTNINGNSGGDIFNVKSISGPTTLNGGNDADTFNVGSSGDLNSIGGLLTINGDGSGGDKLYVTDTADNSANSGTLTPTTISGLGMSGSVAYQTVETLEISLGGGGNTFTINNTTTGLSGPTILNTGSGADVVHINNVTNGLRANGQGSRDIFNVVGTGVGSTTTLNGDDGNDIFNVRSIDGLTTVNAGVGNDTVNVGSKAAGSLASPNNNSGGNLNGIDVLLTVNGDASTGDVLNIDSTGNSAANVGTLTSTSITGLNLSSAGITYGSFEALNISLGTGGDSFTINSTHAATGLETTTLNSGAGQDTVDVIQTHSTTTLNTGADDDLIRLTDIGALLNVNGGAPGRPVDAEAPQTIHDRLIGTDYGDVWRLIGENAGRGEVGSTAKPVVFTGIEDLTGGSGNDEFLVSDGASLSGVIDAKGGNDTFDLTDYSTSVTVDLELRDTFNRSRFGMVNVETVIGGRSSDRLEAYNAVENRWDVKQDNGGHLTTGQFEIDFSSFENLIGGSGTDTFILNDRNAVSGLIAGIAPPLPPDTTSAADHETTNDADDDFVTYDSGVIGDYTGTSRPWTVPVTVDLAAGTATGIGGTATYTISGIEWITGGKVSDTLTGDEEGNVLVGGLGNDTIRGNGGNDILWGGVEVVTPDKFDLNNDENFTAPPLWNEAFNATAELTVTGDYSLTIGAFKINGATVSATTPIAFSFNATAAVIQAELEKTIGVGRVTVTDVSEQQALTANAAGGTNKVTVTNGLQFAIGKAVTVDDGNSPPESFTITAISGNTLTLSGNLSQDFTVAQQATLSIGPVRKQISIDRPVQPVLSVGSGASIKNAAARFGYTPAVFAGASHDGTFGSQGESDGNDVIDAGAGIDFVFGGTGHDALNGGNDADYVDGGVGLDLLRGGDGDDLVRGGANNDLLDGDGGLDQLYGEGGRDSLYGGAGDATGTQLGQRLFGGSDTDFLYAYAPTLDTDKGSGEPSKFGDEMHGGSAGDWLYGNLRKDTLVGDSGKDFLGGDYLAGNIVSGISLDARRNSLADIDGGADLLIGGTGQDTLRGGGGNDALWGGSDTDELEGQDGDDSLYGGSGIDIMYLDVFRDYTTFNDSFDGHGDDNPLDAEIVKDDNAIDILIIPGTEGDDTIFLRRDESNANRLLIDYQTPQDATPRVLTAKWRDGNSILVEQFRIAGLSGNDRIEFAAGDLAPDFSSLAARTDEFVTMIDGGPGRDTLIGTNGRDRIDGGVGSDLLFGFGGDDRLAGDNGDGSGADHDVLYGGEGHDDLLGGLGTNELYAWSVDPRITNSFDTQLGFKTGQVAAAIPPDSATPTSYTQIGSKIAPANGILTHDSVVLFRTASGADFVKVVVTAGSTDGTQPETDGSFEPNTVVAHLVEDIQKAIDGTILKGKVTASAVGNVTDGYKVQFTADATVAGVTALDMQVRTFGVFVDANGHISATGDELEDTGLNRTLGNSRNDHLYGGTGIDFLYGNGGKDTLYRTDGSTFESMDGGAAGDEWKEYAKESDKVWYVGGTDADDTIDVNFVTEPGLLGNHHLITRLTENNGLVSFSASVRLDFNAKDSSGKPIWDADEKVADLGKLKLLTGEDVAGSENEAPPSESDTLFQTKTFNAKQEADEIISGLLPPEGDFLAIIVDALGGRDTITIGPTVQKTVWIDAGAGDDRVEIQGGRAILVDQTELLFDHRNDSIANAFPLALPSAPASIDRPAIVVGTIDAPLDGRLPLDSDAGRAEFQLAVNGAGGVKVTVTRDATLGTDGSNRNQSLADLVSDLNAALTTAGVGDAVQAGLSGNRVTLQTVETGSSASLRILSPNREAVSWGLAATSLIQGTTTTSQNVKFTGLTLDNPEDLDFYRFTIPNVADLDLTNAKLHIDSASELDKFELTLLDVAPRPAVGTITQGTTTHVLSLNGATSGTFKLQFGTSKSAVLNSNATAADVKAALETVTDVVASVSGLGTNEVPFRINATQVFAPSTTINTVITMTVVEDSLTDLSGAVTPSISGTPTNEVQLLTRGDVALGKFSLKFDDGSTNVTPLINASSATVVAGFATGSPEAIRQEIKVAIEGLNAGQITVSVTGDGTAEQPWQIEFTTPAGTDVASLSLVDDYFNAVRDDSDAGGTEDRSPVAYWRLGEASGNVARDNSGSSTVHNALYFNGPELGQPGALAAADTAVTFDGANDLVYVPSSGLGHELNFTTAMTVEAWIRVDAFDRDYQAIVTKGDSAWSLQRFANTDRVSFDTTIKLPDNSTTKLSLAGNRSVNDGQWHHVVGTFDINSGIATKRIYIDGRLDAEEATSITGTLNPTIYWVIIGDNHERLYSRSFEGAIDEVALYGAALGEDEVASHYRTGLDRLVDQENEVLPDFPDTTASRNETVASAYGFRSIQSLTQISGLTLHDKDDVDHYRFSLVRPGIASDKIDVAVSQAEWDVDVQLLTPGGVVVKTLNVASPGGTTTVNLVNVPSGDYILRVAQSYFFTGSVEVASGVVTLTGGTFPSWAADGEVVVGGKSYTVKTRDSDTQVTLDNLAVNAVAGTPFKLGRRPGSALYDLRPDIGSTTLGGVTGEVAYGALDLSGRAGNSLSLASLQKGREYVLKVKSTNRIPTIYDITFEFDLTGEVVEKSYAQTTNAVRRDVILGGEGHDILMGGPGEEWIFGGPGDDVISGGLDRQASDLLFGGDGNDTFQLIPDGLPTIKGSTETFLPTSVDRMDGGPGTDRVLYFGGDRDRLGRPVNDFAAFRYNTGLHRYELSTLVWDIANQTFTPGSGD
ncbi:MAG: hypothetical protein O3A00_03615, partial [Planctomycetota bacterium]|nr:hypothetical protein [Planctomycetota bacterium]